MAFTITEKSSRRIKESYGTTSALTIVPPSPAPVDLSGYPLKIDVDSSLALKYDKTGGLISGDVSISSKLTIGTVNTDADAKLTVNGELTLAGKVAQQLKGQVEVDSTTLYINHNQNYSGGWNLYDSNRAPAQIRMVSDSSASSIAFATKAANTAEPLDRLTINANGAVSVIRSITNTVPAPGSDVDGMFNILRDNNTGYRFGLVTGALDSGAVYLQSQSVNSNDSNTYPIILNPNGGNVYADNGIQSSDFIPGILGQGYNVGDNAQFESLIVTGDLDVRTIRNNIITADNGTRILNNSVTAVDTSTEGAGINKDASGYYFNVEPWLNSMRAGYPIVSQSQSVTGIETLSYTVTDVSGTKVYLNLYDTSTVTTPTGFLLNVNIGTFTYNNPPGFWTITASAANQYCKTADFAVTADTSVYVTASDTYVNNGTMTIALYTAAGVLHTTLWTSGTTFNGTKGTTVTTAGNYQIRCILNGNVYSANVYPLTIQTVKFNAAYAPDVKGRTFVKVDGNPVIETATLPWAPGTRWIKDTSNALVHKQEDILAAIGNLQDLSINGEILDDGAYLPNAYIKGHVEADSGLVGDILIKDGKLSSYNEGERFELDKVNNGLFLYSASENAAVSIHTGNIQDLDDITSITNKNYLGSYATQYTTKTIVNGVGTPQSYMYYTGEYESNASYIKTWDNIPADAYQFDVNINNRYYTAQYEQVDYSYTVPENYIENPGDNQTTHTFSTYGSYNITFDGSILNNNDVALGGHSVTINNRVSQGLSTASISNFVVFDTSKGYTAKKVTITNNFRIKEVISIYGGGNPVYTYETIYPAEVTFTLKTTILQLLGSAEFIEIADNGINAVFSSDKYFSLQKTRDDSYFIKTAGRQLHTSPNFDIVTSGAVGITGNLAVTATTKVKGVEYDEKYSTSSTYDLSNTECLYVFGGSTAGSTVTMPSSPLTGQQHIIINRTTGTTLIITGGAKSIHDNGATVSTFNLGNRHSATLIYNGVAWSLVAYR